ncbi:MAG: SPFH domain-containing protein, partial [Thermoplasmata archaeon]
KSGKRRVIIGPCTALLEYDEVPQILELSTGTPKTDKQIIKTAYLRVRNNKVSDIVEAVTKDMVHVAVKLAYRINFEEEDKPEKWFNVENYINFLCDHTRSLIRNAAKGYGIDEFNQNAINIIRDTVLGKQGPEGKRPGRKFEENGMRIYDIEVLDITIGDETIGNMLVESQHKAVQQAIMLAQKEKELQDTQRIEKITQDIEAARAETESKRYALQTQKLEQELKVKLAEVELDTKVQTERIKAEEAQQELLDRIHEAELARQKLSEDQRLALVEREQKVKLEMMDAEAKAVVQKASAVTPQMVAALQSFGDKVFVEKLMAALGPHALLRGNSVADVFAQLVNSTPEIGGKLKDLLSLLPGNAGFPKEAAK